MLYNIDKGYEAVNYFSKNYLVNKLYREKYSHRKMIGFCVNLYHIHRPVNLMDFAEKWFKYIEDNPDLPIYDRGASEEEVKRYGEEMHDILLGRSGIDVSTEKLTHLIFHHMLTETFIGCKREELIMEYIKKNGLKCRKSLNDSDEETLYGVDIFLLDDNDKEICGIQVKPFKFLNSKRGDVAADRVGMYDKRKALKRDRGLDTLYVVYKDFASGLHLLKNGDNFTFRFNDLWQVYSDGSVYKRSDINLNDKNMWGLLSEW